MSDLRKLLGKRIAYLRKHKKLTQLQLSEMIDISLPALGDIETGVNFPGPETIEKIKNALECEYRELFNIDDKQSIEASYKEIRVHVDYMYKNHKKMIPVLKEIIRLLI